jgi:hypothetical protein
MVESCSRRAGYHGNSPDQTKESSPSEAFHSQGKKMALANILRSWDTSFGQYPRILKSQGADATGSVWQAEDDFWGTDRLRSPWCSYWASEDAFYIIGVNLQMCIADRLCPGHLGKRISKLTTCSVLARFRPLWMGMEWADPCAHSILCICPHAGLSLVVFSDA